MTICIAGKNNIAVEILLYLLNSGCDKKNLCVIPNKTDNGLDNWQRSLLKIAKSNNIKIESLANVYEIENLIFLSLEFDQIIKPSLFKTNRLFNIHFSLLPKYKGMYTSIIPILFNENYTGVTLHKIDKGIDTGDIIDQIEFKIDHNDNARDVYMKYIYFGIELIKKNLFNIIENRHLILTKQNECESSYFSKKSIDFTNITIDLNQTAIDIHNQIRAYNFREYQQPILMDNKIISSKILKSSSLLRPGKVIFENDISIVLSTIDNDIVVYKDKSKEFFNACNNGDEKCFNELIQIPSIINIQNKDGWTPLIVAIYNNHKNIVKSLFINGADINLGNFKGTTPLMYAKSSFVKHKDDEILKLILNMDIDIYQKDYIGKDVLDYCIENKEFDALDIIKESNS